MREINIGETDEQISLGKCAAEFFAANGESGADFYFKDVIEKGGLIALRSGKDDVIVLKISDDYEPVKFRELIKTYQVEE